MINSPSIDRILRGNALTIAVISILVAITILLAFLPEELVLFFGMLLVGLPMAALVVSKRTRNTAVVAMLVLLPLF